MCDHHDGRVEAHRQAAKNSNKRPHLAALVLIAAEEVCSRIQNDEPGIVFTCNPLDRIEQRRLSDLTLSVRSRERRGIDAGEIDDPEPSQVLTADLRTSVYLLKPVVKLASRILGAHIEDVARFN